MNELSLWGTMSGGTIRLAQVTCCDISEQYKWFYTHSAVNFHQIWRTLTASSTFFLPLAKILVCWNLKLKEIA